MVNFYLATIQKSCKQGITFYQKITLTFIHIFLFGLTVLSLCFCQKKEDLASRPYPRVRTISIEETEQGAIFTGEIFYAENSAIIDHGFVWNTVRDAITNTSQSYEKSLGAKTEKGIFSIEIRENVTNNTTYTLRAYASTGNYKVYGEPINFTTRK